MIETSNARQIRNQEIRQAVFSVVAQEGLAGLTMKKVATVAGISPATLYLYYANKEDMISELYKSSRQAFAEASMQGVNELSENFKEAFSALFYNSVRWLIANKDDMYFQQQCVKSPFVTKEIRDETDGAFHTMLMFYENAFQKGQLTKGMTGLLALNFVHGLMQSVVQLIVIAPFLDREVVIAQACQFCLDGLQGVKQ